MVTQLLRRPWLGVCLLLACVASSLWWGQGVRAHDAVKGTVQGSVRVTFQGKPKADAAGVVVYLVGFVEPPAPHVPSLRQRDKAFDPPVLAVTAGQSVAFPNDDKIFHNVFSLSPVRSFDLGQYRNGESKEKVFPKTGVVDIYCNIHPHMAATVLVLPNRRFAVTDKTGRFLINDVPPGNWTLFAYDRFAGQPVKRAVAVVAGGRLDLSLEIDELRADVPHLNKYGQPYREPVKAGGYP